MLQSGTYRMSQTWSPPPPIFRVCVHLLTPKETIFHNYMEAKKQCVNLLMTKWNLYCVVPENIHNPHPPPPTITTEGNRNSKKRGVQKEAISQGEGSVLSRVFPGAPSKIGELLNTSSCSVEQAIIVFFTVMLLGFSKREWATLLVLGKTSKKTHLGNQCLVWMQLILLQVASFVSYKVSPPCFSVSYR